MASTYVNDLRLNELGTGDGSGTWGTTTNTNLELIGEALGFGTEAITTNADTHTSTVADGSTDPARSMYIKYTGALDSNCTITIAPNNISRVHIIENATTDSGSSGPYSIIIKQGSGSTVTIPNGQVSVVYLDGAGSGAAVLDALTDLTIAGTFNAGTNIVAGGAVQAGADITASGTLQATGDTAAGDDAAIGFTSAEGIIVTGQGSTNDITLKNDADADVLVVPTGTTNVDIVGVATAATFEPDGDTAAGDNAAIGFTSAEGLILTGQGSTTDVTIKNDADFTVASIATGTKKLTVHGSAVAANHTADVTGSTTPDFGTYQNFIWTLTGNLTLANPTTEEVGQTGFFIFIQDGSGNRSITLGTDFETAESGGITLSTGANDYDLVPYVIKASDSILLGAIQLNFG